jgi:hypothetical protein
LKSDNVIYLLDCASGKIIRSPLFTSSKNEEDRFIYSGWKKFVKDNRLRYKDRVIFSSRGGDNFLEVQVVRRPSPV